VVVIVHQHIGVNPHPKPLAQLAQQLQKVEAVRVIAEDGLAFVASGHDVRAPAGPLNAQWACPGAIQTPQGRFVNPDLSK
jgi:hypothetical protein